MSSLFSQQDIRKLASLSEITLLATVEALANRRDLKSLSEVLSHFEEEGADGMTYGIQSTLGILTTGPKPLTDSFPRVLLRAIAPPDNTPMGQKMDMDAEQVAYLHRVIGLAMVHSHRPQFAGALMHAAASTLQAPQAFLLIAGANASLTATSKSNVLVGQTPTSFFEEAMACGNSVAVVTMLEQIAGDSVRKQLANFVQSQRPASQSSMAATEEKEAIAKLGRNPDAFLSRMGGAELLNKLAEISQPAQQEDFREAVFTQYLLDASQSQKWNWDERVVTAMLAKDGETLANCATMKRLRECESSDNLKPQSRALVSAALKANCHPVIENIGMAAACRRNHFIFDGLSSSVAYNDAAREITNAEDRARLKRTLAAMMAIGHRLDGEIEPPALVTLAKNKKSESLTDRLVVMLELGCDPTVKDKRGWRPDSEIRGQLRDNWKNVCKSFSARKTAHSVLDEIGNQASPARKTNP